MDSFHIFITVIVVLIIVFIAIGIGWWSRNHVKQEDVPPPNPALINVSHWGNPPIPSDDPTKNVCTLYEFPSDTIIIDGVPIFVPGIATLNQQTLDTLSGDTTSIPRCVDADQIVAQQMTHTCKAPDSDQPSLISTCETLAGERVGVGTEETFYQRCSHPRCLGEMALISANYQVPNNLSPACITRQGGLDDQMKMSPCDPADPNQRFRVTRVNPGQNPGSLEPGYGQSGILAQLLDRNSGRCLMKGTNQTTSDFDPNYAHCGTGPIQPQQGWELILGPCTSSDPSTYPGYNWLMIPSFEYCGVAGGCNGCSGGIVCNRTPGSNVCEGTAGCTGAEPMTIAPQLIYIGDLDISQIPIGTAGYQGLFGFNAIYKWAIDNQATALYYGGSGTGIILGELAGDISQCINSGYVSQYLNVSTYNQLSALKVCIANQPVSNIPCVDL